MYGKVIWAAGLLNQPPMGIALDPGRVKKRLRRLLTVNMNLLGSFTSNSVPINWW